MHTNLPVLLLPVCNQIRFCWQDFYLEDILKFIGYKAPDNYNQDRAGAGSEGSSAEGPLARLQRVATEQAIMDAFLKGDEASWGRLLEVTGALEGSANPACINAAHPATGQPPPQPPGVPCLSVLQESGFIRV